MDPVLIDKALPRNLCTPKKGNSRLRKTYPQENPPLGAQADEGSPLSEELVPHEKEERSLQTSWWPQKGQTKVSSVSEGKTNCSKGFPHLLH
jgi:hypothetical protein